MKLREFAETVDGIIHGDAGTELTGAASIGDASAGDITFLSSPKYLELARNCRASCIIVKKYLPELPVAQIVVANPSYAFAQALKIFFPPSVFPPGVREQAFVAEGASVSEGATILPFAHVSEGARIGDGTVVHAGVFVGRDAAIGSQCLLFPNVTVGERTIIGNRVIIHPGAVIGSDGFGYVFEKGEHHKIPQVGSVVIEDDVEIGANVTIDRATTGRTVIGKGTKIDNLVQVAHNVRIGRHSLIVAQVGIAGSTEIGDYVTLAGQVGVADHAVIESGTIAGGQSGLSGHVAKGSYTGSPAIDHRTWLRAQALFAKLPEMHRKLKELEEKIERIEKGDPPC